VPHLNKSLAQFNKKTFPSKILTRIVTINLCEFYILNTCMHVIKSLCRFVVTIPVRNPDGKGFKAG